MSNRASVSADAVRTALALRAVFDETRRLFQCLARASELLHQADGLTGWERAVLIDLVEAGPRTVPGMAGAKNVSRQHIQSIVNPLAERGLVELADNPRHRRSRLVRVTSAGRDVVAGIRSREGRVIAALAPRLTAADLEVTARSLMLLGELLQEGVPAFGGNSDGGVAGPAGRRI